MSDLTREPQRYWLTCNTNLHQTKESARNYGADYFSPDSNQEVVLASDYDNLRQRVQELENEVQRKMDDWADRVRVLAETQTKLTKAEHQLATVTKELDEAKQWLKVRTESKWKQEDVVERLEGEIDTLDEIAREHHDLKMLVGAVREVDGIRFNMKKYHGAHRCEQHRAEPWENIDTEIDCFCCLKANCDRLTESEKVMANMVNEQGQTIYRLKGSVVELAEMVMSRFDEKGTSLRLSDYQRAKQLKEYADANK